MTLTWQRKATRLRKNLVFRIGVPPWQTKNRQELWEPKGDPNGVKMEVKIVSKTDVDFQAIFDAKIVRKLMKILAEK